MVQARTVDGLLTIGEFSDRCGLSPKMLRTYAAAGLLAPAAVDRVTGYRYYAPRQLHQARIIGRLRQAGMPVRDIASFLANLAIVHLDRWERDLDAEAAARRQALQEVRDWMRPAASALTGSAPAGSAPASSARPAMPRGRPARCHALGALDSPA